MIIFYIYLVGMLITWPKQFSVKKYFNVDDVTDPVFRQEWIRYRKVKGKQTGILVKWDPGHGTLCGTLSGTQVGRYWDPVFGFRQLYMNVTMYLLVQIKLKLNKVLHFPIY